LVGLTRITKRARVPARNLGMTDVIAWERVLASLVVPFLLALLVAWPLWGRPSRDPVGSVAAAAVCLAFAVAFVGREYVHVQRVTDQCLRLEIPCRYRPEPYTRFFVYVGIAMLQTAVLFVIGGRLEDRLRESHVAPPWRR
jgi:hypothetical protein